MLQNDGPGYNRRFARVAVLVIVVLALIAGFAMFSTLPTSRSAGFSSGLSGVLHPLYGRDGGVTRDALKRAL